MADFLWGGWEPVRPATKAIPADKLDSKKGEIMEVNNALQYLIKFQILPGDFAAAKTLHDIVKANEWDKKKK
jgi:hypothetical protein